MTRILKSLVSFLIVLAMLLSMPIYSLAEELGTKNITVVLDETDNGPNNYSALMDAFAQASASQKLVIKIAPKGGTYKLCKNTSSSTTGLRIRPNTTLDLNGSTLVRSNKMGNLIQVCDINGKRDTGGYNLATNITVMNGTLDGSGNTTTNANLVNVGHSSNLTFKNLNFKYCKSGHLLEFSGCKDCLVDNCTFTGYDGEGKQSEAIQLDIAARVVVDKEIEIPEEDNPTENESSSWNGVYASRKTGTADNTPNVNITIQNCTFKDYPMGIGNHKTVYGHPNKGIKILNNKFENSLVYKNKQNQDKLYQAIWAYWFVDSEISGNIITGNYSTAIQCSAGSCTVKNNTIFSKSSPLNANGIYFTAGYGYVPKEGNVDYPESEYYGTTGGKIDNNKIYTIGDDGIYPIKVYSGSHVTEINNNTIIASKSKNASNAISISGKGSSVDKINGNSITTKYGVGIKIANNAKAGNIDGNKVTSSSNALCVSSNGSVKKCKNNVFTVTGKNAEEKENNAVYITSSTITRLEGNTAKSPYGFGIYFTSNSNNSKTTAVMNDLRDCAKSNVFGNSATTARYFGQSRYLTSFATSEALKAANGNGTYYDNIIIANGANFPDALAGSYLAAKIGAPIIMACAPSGSDDSAGVLNYLNKSYNQVGKIYILGGDTAVSTKFENTLKKKYGKDKVERLAGEGRYETNLEILKAANMTEGEELLICDAYGFADALSVSALGKPILLINKSNPELSSAQKEYIKKASKVYIIGGTAAVPSKYETLVKSLGKTCERVAGNDRYETSLNIAKKFFNNPRNVVIATGLNFPDGLCGGTVAYSLGAPLILTRNSTFNGTTNEVYKLAKSFVGNKNLVVLGGTGALDNNTVRSIKDGGISSREYISK